METIIIKGCLNCPHFERDYTDSCAKLDHKRIYDLQMSNVNESTRPEWCPLIVAASNVNVKTPTV